MDWTLAHLQALSLDAVDLLEKIAVEGSSEGQEGLDLQMIEDAMQTALAFLGNTAMQFSAYRRTKILKEYNKDLVSFFEEQEPELRCAAPLLFGKARAKPRKVFSRPPSRDKLAGKGGASYTTGASVPIIPKQRELREQLSRSSSDCQWSQRLQTQV